MVADGRSTALAGKGNVTLKIGKLEVQLSNVLYVPNMASNLISATKMGRQMGANIAMRSDGTCVLQRDQDIVELHTHTDGVHALQVLHRAGSPLRWDPVLDKDRRATPPQLDECDSGLGKAGDGKPLVPRSEGTRDFPNTSRPDRPRANPMKPRLSSGQP
eukprot:scaffold244_cov372-Pavlova_lutheri.AAC.2